MSDSWSAASTPACYGLVEGLGLQRKVKNGSGLAQDYVTPPFLVVALGASAGGLEAVSRLLSHIPSGSALSFILAQHLSRNHPSLLPEVLSRRTTLRCAFGADHDKVEVGRVYVVPPGKHLTVIDGHLRVSPRPEGPWARQVDALFCSLAQFYQHKAVGVILSGALSDGSQGARAIRAAGGITFAQSPAQAELDSMPRAAIAVGVDHVLTAEGIGEALLRLSASPRFKD